MSNGSEANIPPSLKYLNDTLQSINLMATQLCRLSIHHSSTNKQRFTPGVPVSDYLIPAEEFENISISLLDLSSKVSSCQGVVTKLIDDATGAIDKDAAEIPRPTEVNNNSPVDTSRDPQEPFMQSFIGLSLEGVVSQYIGNHGILRRFQKGLDDYTTEESTLPKFKESVDNYTPDQVVNWPDGWYRANNDNHRELLITLDALSRGDHFTPRILIKYNLRELVEDNMLHVYIAEGSTWLREEYFSQGVLKAIKNKIVFKSHELKRNHSIPKAA